jgi:ADP-ribose pyrophosphatase YjhB (NUDIX family)
MIAAVAAVIVQDKHGRILAVRTGSGGAWRLPGGRVKPGEKPTEVAIREAVQVLGVPRSTGALVALGWQAAEAGDELLFIFDGGLVERVPPPAAGTRDVEVGYFTLYELVDLIPAHRRSMATAAIDALRSARPVYVEGDLSVHEFAWPL